MSERESLFDARSRIAFNNSLYGPLAPKWEFGTVTEKALRPSGYVYRISWDDGFVDHPGTAGEWYEEEELVAEGLAVEAYS